MYREFHIMRPDGDFSLSLLRGTGIIIKKPAGRTSGAKLLFKNARGEMDVCMTPGGTVFIMAQTQNGVIFKITDRDGVWRRFDVLVPKSGGFHEKKFALCPSGCEVFVFFSLTSAGKTALMVTTLSKSGRTPAAAARLSSWDAFDGASDGSFICAALEDEAGTLSALISEPSRKKTGLIPLLSGGGFSNIRVRLQRGALFTAFIRGGRVFLIQTDIRARVTREIRDMGEAAPGARMAFSVTDGAPVVYLVSENKLVTVRCGGRSRAAVRSETDLTGLRAREIKRVYPGECETETVI